MNRRELIRFVDLRNDAESKTKRPSFFDLLEQIDFRDDLRYK